MKTQQIENLKKQTMYNGMFAAKTNATAKKQVNALNTINKIEAVNVETIVALTLNEYKPILAQLPKAIRGNALKAFCNAVRRVLGDFGTAFCLDNYGNVITQRIINKFSAKYESELLVLLCNLLQDAAKDADNAVAEAEAKKRMLNDAKMNDFVELLAELQNVA